MGQPGIIKLLSNGVRRALGLLPPGWSLKILPDDVFLVSFPKSGNTWTRFLLGNLISPDEPATFSNIPMLVPDPLGTPTKVFDRMPRPRIIKSHECFDPRYPRVIYIVRDPRDVVVSQYHYHRKIREIADDMPIEAFVRQFLVGKTWPCGSWVQHVVTWLGTSEGDPRFLLVRYEDMVEDTSRELRKIIAFTGLKTSEKQIALAVERSTAGRMRELEQAQSEGSDRMIGRESRKDIMFVRAAGSGGWREDLPMPMVERIEAAWGPMMRHLGYELATQVLSEARDYVSLGIELSPTVNQSVDA
jgi:hypothetical protein